MTESTVSQANNRNIPKKRDWIWDLILVVVLAIGIYFRFIGLNWGENTHLHPDERFLTMVETSIQPVNSISDYFNTEQSTLNPHNRGYGFYVYGTLPLFTVRYLAEWLNQTGYDQVFLVGRGVSAFLDVCTILLVYLATIRLYRNPKMALLAAGFFACSVLPIQLSHYFTVDNFANFFVFLSFTIATWILTDERLTLSRFSSPAISQRESQLLDEPNSSGQKSTLYLLGVATNTLPLFILFGVALGMAVASKISAAPLAIILPAALLIRYIQLPVEDRQIHLWVYFRNLVVAALVSLVVFRIFQPYAFSGPGFFGVIPNQRWVDNMREISLQSSGDVDFPPALQWARRPIWFAWENIVKWGLGIPLGVLAWTGFVWMGWRIFRGEWKKNAILWIWTAVFFSYQSINFTRSMRYQLPIYPTLAIIAAWAVFALWEFSAKQKLESRAFLQKWGRIVAIIVGVGVSLCTLLWAYAFVQIYQRPMTRVEASRWIYQNVPAAINLHIETPDGLYNQPVGFRLGLTVDHQQPMVYSFIPQVDGILSGIHFDHISGTVTDATANVDFKNLTVLIADQPVLSSVLTTATIYDSFSNDSGDFRGKSFDLVFDQALTVVQGKQYYVILNTPLEGYQLNFSGPILLEIHTDSGSYLQGLPDPVNPIRVDNPYQVSFQAARDGILREIYLPHLVDLSANSSLKTIQISVTDVASGDSLISSVTLEDAFIAEDDPRGSDYKLLLATPVTLSKGHSYSLKFEIIAGAGSIALYGSKQVDESTWDDPLPRDIDGYSPFDYSSGLFRTELNFEMYWDDNADKLQRFLTGLNQADYIFISSNRQWGTTVRVPERYPLTTVYYRSLIGCPDDKAITWCYSVAEPGMFEGNLGFELVKVVQSDPSIGPIRFNTQFAEEAFTVYDHPKVLIFQKKSDFDYQHVESILSSVDLSKVIHLTPKQATRFKGTLMLPDELLARQRTGGTWSDLFNRDALRNRYPWVGLLIWYLVISLLGWICYPLTRAVFWGLKDKGFPLTRLLGLLCLASLVWLAGSAGIAFNRTTISVAFVVLALVNLTIFLMQRDAIIGEVKNQWRYYLVVEGLILLFFAFDLAIRLGNPDLWHPYKGGEKPMDFSYFNAVLKSTIFPPYDPWFAGGYINYYYYGFVLVGVPVKWLGIIPSIAYNLILPTMFSLLSIGAFCVGWNLVSADCQSGEMDKTIQNKRIWLGVDGRGVISGFVAAVFLAVLGNLGTLRMIWHGFQKLAAPGGMIDGASFFQRWAWTFAGLAQFMNGVRLPYGQGEWYWIPSRAFPNEPITEFPFFTFLYADPHAHLFALPLTVLALCWVISLLKSKWDFPSITKDKFHSVPLVVSFVIGGLIIGSLYPTNTWDFPTYLTIAVVVLLYSGWRYAKLPVGFLPQVPVNIRRFIYLSIWLILLVCSSFLLYQPFSHWYGQGYTRFRIWEGDHTPFWSYITHWGLFLFVILSWFIWETRDWMAKTPVSSLRKISPYWGVINTVFALLVVITAGLLVVGVKIAWLVLPMAFWAGILILRPGQSDEKRLALFFTGTALVLTLLVELIALDGDIGRMNTVFKFYLQAWTLFSLSAAFMLILIYPQVLEHWRPLLRSVWQGFLAFLVGSAALFTLLGGADKIRDRMTREAPHTLDGMAYMAYSTYFDFDGEMQLRQDYDAIRWMQDNIPGSPVIVESNVPEYRWGTRYTIYTGLPGVVGWNWHQRQQRALVSSNWVTERVDAVGEFYRTTNRQATEDFLKRYDVQYIILGQLEQLQYQGEGLIKFQNWEGDLWRTVYHNEQTTIYEVIR